ncbi:MAG: ferritin family protein, partial [Candidatus Aminicenantes bacterium]|nr:ferritin family protein [Candidatus Aminicenantes bacterium]
MTIEEAIKTAIQYEKRVVQVYEDAARSSADDVGKKIFSAFIKEEEQHVAYLVSRLDEWKATGQVTAASLGTVIPARERIEEGIRSLEGRVKRTAPETEMRLLKRALDIEVETSAFYARVVKELPPEHRPLFERFVEIEQGHQAIVQAEINAVAGNGYWFDIPEITMEG